MREARRTYLPAAGHAWFLPFYDPLVKLLGGDSARRRLLDRAGLRSGHRILDIGCGTGSLAVLTKRVHPDVEVVGLDPDPAALGRGRRKARRAGVSIRFDEGFADELPYSEASFDRVFSSFMFHHLEPSEKESTLCEVRQVLKPGGSLHMLDFGGSETGRHGFLGHLLHSSQPLRDNSESRILALMSQARLSDARKVGQQTMLFLSIAYYQACVRVSDVT
jgi:ubiquinone/menaquinone biosynthesis C-methylase UbiE